MPDRSGSFVTTNEKVGTIQMWNVAKNEPTGACKFGNKGTCSMILLNDKNLSKCRVLIASKNGAVLVYNVKRQVIEFSTEQGHFETIFEVQYCQSNRDLLASCSYDGTVRIWNSNNMKLVNVNDTNFNSAQAQSEKKIIYSISWNN